MSTSKNLLNILTNLEKKTGSNEFPLSRKIENSQPAIIQYINSVIHLPFTLHDWQHSSEVERLCVEFIPDKILQQLRPKEIFILILGLWLHDGGMVPEHQDQSIDDVRKDHHIRIKDRIDSNVLEFLSDIGLKEREALGILCASHCFDNLDDVPESFFVGAGLENDIRLKFLSAILRLCDICDISCKRTPLYIFNNFKFSKDSQRHWEKHLLINGIKPIHDKKTIIKIQGSYTNEIGLEYLNEISKNISNELKLLSPIFLNFGWIVSDTINSEFKEKFPDGNKDLKVLSSNILRFIFDHIYEDKTIYVRELVQNSIDAHKIKSIIYEMNKVTYEPVIKISEYYDFKNDIPYPIAIVIFDNGIGMNQSDITDKLLEIGHQTGADSDINKLLNSDKLIARFGIGFLSCLPIANKIIVETQKDNFFGLKIEFPNYSIYDQGIPKEKIRITRIKKSESGTLIKIFLNDHGQKIHILDSLKKFCHNIKYPIHYHSEKWTNNQKIIELNKIETGDRIFHNLTGSDIKKENKISFNGPSSHNKQFEGLLGYFGDKSHNHLIICQEGIFIEDCISLIPDDFFGIEGEIDLKSGLIDLTASRNRINRDEKFNSLKLSLEPFFFQLLGKVISNNLIGEGNPEYGNSRNPIIKILNQYSKKFENDKEKLKKFFETFDKSIMVYYGDRNDRKSLFDLRNLLENKKLNEIYHVIDHKIIISSIPAGTIEGYNISLDPKYTKIKCKSLLNQNKVVFRTSQVTESVEKEELYDELLIKRQFFRQYFELFGHVMKKYEPNDISPMIFNSNSLKYPEYESLVNNLREKSKIKFFSTDKSIRFLLNDNKTCYINVSHPKIKEIFDKYFELKKQNRLGDHFENLILSYFLLTSFNIQESLEKMEESMIEYLEFVDDL